MPAFTLKIVTIPDYLNMYVCPLCGLLCVTFQRVLVVVVMLAASLITYNYIIKEAASITRPPSPSIPKHHSSQFAVLLNRGSDG